MVWIWIGLYGMVFLCTCKVWYLIGSYLCVGLVGLGWGSRSVGIMFHEELKIVGSRLDWARFTDTELTNDILSSEEKT